MNPAHVVLRNWDILQVIIHFVKADFRRASSCRRRDLVAISLVCRVLSDLALDALWTDFDMKNIHVLFPMDMVRVHPRGEKSLTRVPATPQEWERFDIYASRIRELSASPSSNDLFLRGVRMRYPTLHHPFPNLTCLQWESTPSDVIGAMPLICPTIMEMQLSIDTDPNEDEDDDAVADILRSLGETCSRLEKFEYTHFSFPNNRSKAVETSLVYLIRQCRRLENVHLPVSRDILRALGSLPDLSTLLLEHVAWKDGSQLSLPLQADEWIEADRFPVLDRLTIQYSHTVSSLTECFQGSGCFPRTSFTMWEMSECEQWSTLAIGEFLSGILRPDRRATLRVFCIDRETAVQNPVGHDPWQGLRFLSSISNLRTLSLEGLFLDINDTDLEQIPRMWPKLRYLDLGVPRFEDYQSQISFQGLAHLSTLENLETLSLMLAPESTISESMFSPSTWSNSRLNHLTIQGKFPPVTPYAATMFLILHFPRLKWICGSLYLDKEEKDRIQEIQVLLDGVRPVMTNLRSERRGRGSVTGVEQEGVED